MLQKAQHVAAAEAIMQVYCSSQAAIPGSVKVTGRMKFESKLLKSPMPDRIVCSPKPDPVRTRHAIGFRPVCMSTDPVLRRPTAKVQWMWVHFRAIEEAFTALKAAVCRVALEASSELFYRFTPPSKIGVESARRMAGWTNQ